MDDKARFSTLSYSLEEAVLLLVFVVLFLSLCWQHHRPPRQSLNLNPPPEEVIPGVGEFNGELLPISKYRKEEANGQVLDNECSVCLQAFMEGEDLRQLPECKHSFHAACIDMWLYSHSSCPLCRADVAVLRPLGCLTPDAEETQDELPV